MERSLKGPAGFVLAAIVFPDDHVNVDRYVVGSNGSITGPTPVKLMSLDGGPITAASDRTTAATSISSPHAHDPLRSCGRT